MSKEIQIVNLCVGYNEKIVLQNINISTHGNQLIAIIGRNGIGKSTLIKTLSGLQDFISGDFLINNKSILKLPEKNRAKELSIVSTNHLSIGNILVKDFIAFGRYPYTNWLGTTNEKDLLKVNEAIELCGIESLSDRNYQELSDGEKQRVNIARAIAQDTELIILDEPTTHLDLINKIEVFSLLKKLVEELDKTIFFSTHMVDYALQMADEIWLVDNKTVTSLDPNNSDNLNKIKQLFSNDRIIFDTKNKTFRLA